MYFRHVFAFTLALTCALLVEADDEKYTTKFDNINLDEILNNKRLLVPYVDCLLGKGSCTPDGTQLKEIIPEALANDCAKCSEKQRKGATHVLKHLYQNEQELYKQLEAKFDPEGKFKEQYKSEAAKEGVTI